MRGNHMKRKPITRIASLLIVAAFVFNLAIAQGENAPLAPRIADTILTIWKDYPGATPNRPARWSYEQGVVLKGIERVWKQTGDGKYFAYIKQTMDQYVLDDGTIRD